MKALVLVGGKGTRLYPLTYTLPKPLVPIVDRPFVGHMLARLRNYGVTEVVMSMCYLPDMLRQYVDSEGGFGMKVSYVVEECPLGTGGAIKNAADKLDETFLVFNGDILTDLDLSDMIKHHRRNGAMATISLSFVEDPSLYGVIDTDENGRIHRFVEKPAPGTATSHYINAGTYIFEPEVLDYIPDGQEYSLERRVYPDMLQVGKPLYGYKSDAYWLDIGNPTKYLQAHRDIALGRVNIEGIDFRTNDIVISETAMVSPGASLRGPVYIAPGVKVMNNADIGPFTFIGRGSIVDSHSRVVESILWDNVVVGEGSVLNHAIIGSNTRIRPSLYLDPGAIIGCDERL